MKIEFVNHSSFLVETRGVGLLCDPWLFGTAFNDGWALLSPTTFGPADFERVTHIWFSHEHPDHFSPASLRAIPEELRSRICVLYQVTADQKVVEFCAGMGFKEVKELQPDAWVELAAEVSVQCGPWTSGDSWLALRTPEATLLNVNDCAIYTPAETAAIREKVGPVDVLATQFSISSWDGNPQQVERRRAGAKSMLSRAKLHCQEFDARWVIPFASFVWFCHEENFFMNSEHNRIDDVARALDEDTPSTPVVLYPGDEWEVGEARDSSEAIRRYLEDIESVATRDQIVSPEVGSAELEQAAREFSAKVCADLSPLRLRLRLAMQRYRQDATGRRSLLARLASLATLRIPQPRIWVTDLAAAYRFDLFRGLRPSGDARADCDLTVGADSLHYAFRFLWGGETLQINGRFEEIRPEGRRPLFQYFWLAGGRNRGVELGWGALLRRRLGLG